MIFVLPNNLEESSNPTQNTRNSKTHATIFSHYDNLYWKIHTSYLFKMLPGYDKFQFEARRPCIFKDVHASYEGYILRKENTCSPLEDVTVGFLLYLSTRITQWDISLGVSIVLFANNLNNIFPLMVIITHAWM